MNISPRRTCLRCLLEQLDDLVVPSLSGIGQSGIAIGLGLILLCSRGKEEPNDIRTERNNGVERAILALFASNFPASNAFTHSTWPLRVALIKGVSPWPSTLSLFAPCAFRISRCPSLEAYVRAVYPILPRTPPPESPGSPWCPYASCEADWTTRARDSAVFWPAAASEVSYAPASRPWWS